MPLVPSVQPLRLSVCTLSGRSGHGSPAVHTLERGWARGNDETPASAAALQLDVDVVVVFDAVVVVVVLLLVL